MDEHETKRMCFEGFGTLNSLNTDDYYAGGWDFVSVAEAEDGKEYDIVVFNGNLWFTLIEEGGGFV